MKLRHAAALALVGWYLMVPPLASSQGLAVNLHAPLWKWISIGNYDSADACSKQLEFERELAQNPDYKIAAIFANGQYVTSDDPRLNSN
jgi:hypothetical protein